MNDMETTLRRGLLELDLALSDHQVSNLLAYLALIQKWTKVYNLTAVRDPAEMLTHHLLDSLAVIEPLRQKLARLADAAGGVFHEPPVIANEVRQSMVPGSPRRCAPFHEQAVIANEVWQSMTSGLHGLPRCARSDEISVQGPCAVSGRIQKARDDGSKSVCGIGAIRGARNDESMACVVADSQTGLQAMPKTIRLLDVGSGAGLPGVVIAICCPDITVHCVDTVGKKAAFIQQVAVTLKLPNLRGLHDRVENLTDKYQVISSRAFASLPDFTNLSVNALAEAGIWMAMKGKHPMDEMTALPDSVNVFHVEQLVVPGLAADRCIVWMGVAR